MASPKTPVLVLSLIFTMLVLSVGSIALIVLFNANRPDSAAIAAACKSEVGSAIKTESAKVAKACEEKPAVPATKKVVANANHPGFSYPENVQVTGGLTAVPTNLFRHFINIYKDAPIAECTDCDGGPIAAIRIEKGPSSLILKTNETLAQYIAASYQAKDSIYRNVTVKAETLNGQAVTVVNSEYDDDFFGQKNVKVEHIFAQIGTSIVQVVSYQYADPSFSGALSPNVWSTVRSSLVFSKIE